MEMNTRKEIRLKNYDYSLPGAYFITICIDKRKKILWDGNIDLQRFSWQSVGANCVRPKNLPLSHLGEIVRGELEKWDKTYKGVSLHSYVIMPNHLHLIVAITADENGRTQFAPTVGRMVKQFKGAVTKAVGRPIWQKSFMEHIIRSKNDYTEISNYIYQNPLNWHFDELYS